MFQDIGMGTAWVRRDGLSILVLPTPGVVVQDIDGDPVVGRVLRPVKEGEQGATLVKGFSRHDDSVPDLHPDPVSGLQFVNTLKRHGDPSSPPGFVRNPARRVFETPLVTVRPQFLLHS